MGTSSVLQGERRRAERGAMTTGFIEWPRHEASRGWQTSAAMPPNRSGDCPDWQKVKTAACTMPIGNAGGRLKVREGCFAVFGSHETAPNQLFRERSIPGWHSASGGQLVFPRHPRRNRDSQERQSISWRTGPQLRRLAASARAYGVCEAWARLSFFTATG